MINLFNIQQHQINTNNFNNFLHGTVVQKFEESFCEYVGAKYACSINSATNAIFLCLLQKEIIVKIPSIIPPVVLNAIITSGNYIEFEDNIDWIGNSYTLHDFGTYKIIDSAQKVDKNQFQNEANNDDLMIFSFYPTKPIGSCDGGIIVSNDAKKIEWFKEATMNGMTHANNNWERIIKFPGWKMYMNSIQAFIALENLRKLDSKKTKIAEIRNFYNSKLNLQNTSDHLYRINIPNNTKFIDFAKKHDITCGIHYNAMHLSTVYCKNKINLPLSEKESESTVSIPMHENMTIEDASHVISVISKYQ